MNLNKYSKDELIYIIKQLTINNDYKLKAILHQIDTNKATQDLDLLKKYEVQGQKALQKYVEVLKPYNGLPTQAIPYDVIKKAMQYFEEYQIACKKESELTKRLIK